MEDHQWMYTGRKSKRDFDGEWKDKTNDFLELAWANSHGYVLVWCPCTKCDNKRRVSKEDMGRHPLYNGFTKDYIVWIYHGEAHRMREEVVRPRLEACDDDVGVVDMLEDAHQALFNDTRDQEATEEEAKLLYKMMDSTKIPLHENTTVSQLDDIGRLLGVKSELNISRAGFNRLLVIVGSLLPKGHSLPTSMYESTTLFKALKMPYEKIDASVNGCVLFRMEHTEATHCPKCKSLRLEEVPAGDGQMKETDIAQKIIWYLPFVPRIQRLYISEKTAKQMTWYKHGIRYSPDKMVHPSDGEA
jgi:hypothetical protein